MTKKEAFELVLEAAEHRADILLGQATDLSNKGQFTAAAQTRKEHLVPLRMAIELVKNEVDF